MTFKALCGLLLAGALTGSVHAASGDAGGATTGASPTAQKAGSGSGLVQKMRDDLAKAGFTDIQIMPSSFLVRAKDSAGNPVMMVINPDSVAAVTEESQPASSANASNRQGSPNAAGATPGPQSTGGAQPVTPGGAPKSP